MIYDAEMQWLEAKQGAKDSAFVSTTFDLENGEKEKSVEFEQAFPKGSDVQVIGWVQSFRFATEDAEQGYACDFWATKVTPKGFTAHAECGSNAERLTVTYIALKKGKEKVATGSFSTGDDGKEGENSQEIKGKVDFEEGAFDKAPTVLVALSQFELAGGKDLRIGVEVEEVTESGFSWVIRKRIRRMSDVSSANVDQVHGETMQRAPCTAQRLRSSPLGTSNITLRLIYASMPHRSRLKQAHLSITRMRLFGYTHRAGGHAMVYKRTVSWIYLILIHVVDQNEWTYTTFKYLVRLIDLLTYIPSQPVPTTSIKAESNPNRN
jgi:hypothetical protein